jgi:hypothetical protein
MLDGRGRVRITDFGLALSHDDATGRSVPDADVTSANGPRKQSLLQSKVCSFWMNLHLNSRSRNRATSAPRICSPLAARLRFTNGERWTNRPGQSSRLQPRSSPAARDHGQNMRVGDRRDPLRSATERCSVAMTAQLAAPFLVDRSWLRSTARQPDLGAWLPLSPEP